MNIKIRELNQNDHAFVKETMYLGVHAAHRYHNKHFSQLYKYLIKRILETATGLVVCDSQNEDCIYSFIVGSKTDSITIIHYLYTKQHFRKFGLAQKLINQYNQNNNTIYHSFYSQLKTDKYRLIYLPDYKHIGEVNT